MSLRILTTRSAFPKGGVGGSWLRLQPHPHLSKMLSTLGILGILSPASSAFLITGISGILRCCYLPWLKRTNRTPRLTPSARCLPLFISYSSPRPTLSLKPTPNRLLFAWFLHVALGNGFNQDLRLFLPASPQSAHFPCFLFFVYGGRAGSGVSAASTGGPPCLSPPASVS